MDRTRAFSWLAFLIPLSVYLLTAAPGIYWEDSAAFQTAAAELGIVHNPSFPIYVLTAHLFTWLPGSTPQWWVNVASGLFMALTCLLLFRLGLGFLRREGEQLEAIYEVMLLLCVVAFAFVYGVWIQAVRAEVYALNALFVTLTIWLLLRFVEANIEIGRFAALMGLLVGLSLANHYLIYGAVVVPLALAAAINYTERLLRPRVAGLFAVFCFVGLLSYLYLPIRESYMPIFSWGDFSSLGGFFRSVLRIDATLPIEQLTVTTPYLLRLSSAIGALVHETPLLIMIFAVFGLIQSWRRSRFGFVIVILPIVTSLLVTAYAADFSPYNLDLYGYLIPAFAMIFLAAAVGAAALTQEILKRQPSTSPAFRLGVPMLIAFALVVKASYLFGINYTAAAKNGVCEADIYAQSLLESLPTGALFLAGEDNSFSPLLCKQGVDGLRKDVIVISTGALLRRDYRVKLQQRHPELYYSAAWDQDHFAEDFINNLNYWIGINAPYRPVAMTLSQWTSQLIPRLQPSGFAYLYGVEGNFTQKAAAISVQFYNEQGALWRDHRDRTTREHFGRLLYNLAVFYHRHQQPVIAAKYNRDAADCDAENVDLLLSCLKLAIATRQADDQRRFTEMIVELDPGNRQLTEIQRAAYAVEHSRER